VQNGTTDDVKKIVTVLNEAEVPSEDAVGERTLRPIESIDSAALIDVPAWFSFCVQRWW
jgi:hypothetical protein